MLSRENAKMPAATKPSRPSRTSGRRVRLKVRSPLSRDCPPNFEDRMSPDDSKPGESQSTPLGGDGRHFPRGAEVQIGAQWPASGGVFLSAWRGGRRNKISFTFRAAQPRGECQIAGSDPTSRHLRFSFAAFVLFSNQIRKRNPGGRE